MKKIALATILSYTTILSACDRDCKTEQIEKIGGQSESKSEVASEPRVNNIVDEKNKYQLKSKHVFITKTL